MASQNRTQQSRIGHSRAGQSRVERCRVGDVRYFHVITHDRFFTDASQIAHLCISRRFNELDDKAQSTEQYDYKQMIEWFQQDFSETHRRGYSLPDLHRAALEFLCLVSQSRTSSDMRSCIR